MLGGGMGFSADCAGGSVNAAGIVVPEGLAVVVMSGRRDIKVGRGSKRS